MIKINDITKFTLQDYPGHTACILWFNNCNLRCKYCHNVELLGNESENFIRENDVINFLKSRSGLIDGVVFSGGECTLSNDIVDFIPKVKNIGFKIKIDTNGLKFDVIKNLIDNNFVDFIALDFKAPKNKFTNVTQINEVLYDSFEKSLKYLIDISNKELIDMEIRTTVHTSLLDENDINCIIEILDKLQYSNKYYIQNFRNDNKRTLVDIGDQKHIVDISKINKPNNFTVEYRNFF